MSDTEGSVAQHNTTGGLSSRVLSALRALGNDPDNASVADLKARRLRPVEMMLRKEKQK